MPFYLDLPLHHIDQWLFAGSEPWRITHWLFSSPFATMVINVIYNLWFFYVLFFVAYLILSKESNWKKQVFLVFFLTWFINGNVFATLMSSVGPCFYDYLHPQNPAYQGLMALLQEQNQYLIDNGWLELWSLNTQNMLWDVYNNSESGFGAGISAMPSMHNSMAILIALAVSQRHKGLGYCAWAFAAIIYIGSIHLGWHYATDGMVALVLTLIIWTMVDKCLTRKAPQTLPPASEQSPL
ncbi:phosphatase PAP2 family protein (plasmid) [Vibrio sp. HB236076]|uniref:Phosphatase PAP2 family protein n=2 Tax=unclassified Vibrio TaxID=2614977 RepID=A0AB39HF54_9VIBR